MSTATALADLHAAVPLVGPSLLACDVAYLADEIRRLEAAGAHSLHLDVMDGHFVPNISFGVPVVEAVRRVTNLPLDVHLMIENPESYLRPFREAGADLLTIHIEVAPDPRSLLDEIHDLGCGAGIALNPPTPVAAVAPYLSSCDVVLSMSVMPGFGGQAFEPEVLDKIRQLRQLAGPNLLLSVDGGVNTETVVPCAAAGADMFITGTALFSQANYTFFIREMTTLAKEAKQPGL